MCCQKLSDFLTLNKCCCGIPLKAATYIAGGLMLTYCTFTEIDAIQHIYIHDTRENEDLIFQDDGVVLGAGTGIVDHAMRSRDGFQITTDYVQNFMRGLFIAWNVINGLLILSTCLMLYGNAKNKSILLLQWLVVIATIGIGNLADVIIAIIYVSRSEHYVRHRFKHVWFAILLVQCVIETVAIFFAFVVVRSYYYRLTLPSIPISFNALKNQDHQNTTEEEEDTAIKHGDIEV